MRYLAIVLRPFAIMRSFAIMAVAVFPIAVVPVAVHAQVPPPVASMRYMVSMPDPANHIFHVSLFCKGVRKDLLDCRMPAWTPGYYQIMNYAKHLDHFQAHDGIGRELVWDKTDSNTWRVQSHKSDTVLLEYDVMTTKQFVAESWLDESRAYITPAGVFLYVEGYIRNPVTVEVKPGPKWKQIATGLDSVAGRPNVYRATDFDVLYDSPILVGDLESLAPFYVRGVPHYFVGWQLGEFDRQQLMNDLKKIVEASVAVIGDLPYKHYTFIGIGPGRGGIEHLNSTTIGFSGKDLGNPGGRERMLSFITHEYFHHYNVKRIRPVALGPFDYQRENRTNMLWVSEGLTVYYEYLIPRRAGLLPAEDMLKAFQRDIAAFENSPGHRYQSLTSASAETWSEGPFGRKGDSVNMTISYYEKGPAVGMLLDFAIRHATNNQKSLDDVMRLLYKQFYKDRKRGFTDEEFQEACETVAGTKLEEVFSYTSTTKDLDYTKYLGYAGLSIEPGTWKISLLPNPDAGQLAIRKSWLGE
jgi:predicted metalloprotease with PDZ domain